MQLSENAYNWAKWVVTIFLPAFGALYAGLSELLGLPAGLEVVGATSLLAVFLGTILGISNANYKKSVLQNAGYIDVVGQDPDTGLPQVQLDLTKDPTTPGKDTVVLKVGQNPNQAPPVVDPPVV
jgi:hypothetical protein